MKRVLVSFAAVTLASCAAAPVPPPPDFGPIGAGLQVIGFSLIGVAVVVTLGRFVR